MEDNDTYLDMFNNEHLPSYKTLKSKVRTSAIICTNPLKHSAKEDFEFLHTLLLDWYQKWKSVIFIHDKEYYGGYLKLDMICNLMAHEELPNGVYGGAWEADESYSDTETWLQENWDEDSGRATTIEGLNVVRLLERQKQKQNKKNQKINGDKKGFSERLCKDGWNPSIKNIVSPIKVSLSVIDGDEKVESYLESLLFEWGDRWNDEIIVHYETMTNYITLRMTCSKKAYWALPSCFQNY